MKDFKENFNLKDWKVHVLCLVIMVIAELIGTQKISITGPGGKGIAFSLIPMLFAIIIGIVLGGTKRISRKTMETASPYIGICVMFLIDPAGVRQPRHDPAVHAAGGARLPYGPRLHRRRVFHFA